MTTLAPLPTVPGGFRVVTADPPFRFKSNSVAKPGRNAMRHYPCMSLAEIAAMPVASIVADDAALFLWIPSPLLVVGKHIPIMEAWGFKPCAFGFVWTKLNQDGSVFSGTGFTTRKSCEVCILGKRGRSVRRAADVGEAIMSPRREHSRKPDEFYDRVFRYSAGPRLDLFARSHHEGFVAWGDEATKFDSGKDSTMKIVCFTCGLGPRDGTALFSTATDREKPQPETRFCAEHLPLREVQRRVEAKAPIDADILAIFQRRIAEASRAMAAE